MSRPQPRFRIYSSPGDYATIAQELTLFRRLKGDSCQELESAISKLTGAAHAICMVKARVAIFLAIRALVRDRKKIILSPYTISDVINMVVCAGGTPVFADIERETCNVDPAECEKHMDKDTAAVLVTHLHGLACDMERLAAMCKAHRVLLVEDAAQAFGARIGGKPVGTFGTAGIYSFGMYKNVNAFFGGMLVTSDSELAERLRKEVESFPPQELGYYFKKALSGLATDVATFPPIFKATVFPLFRYGFLNNVGLLNRQVAVDSNPTLKTILPEGYLRKMTPLQARLILRQFGRVDSDARDRIAAARVYHDGLSDLPGVILPPLREDLSHIYSYFPIQVVDRRALIQYMLRNNRDVALQHLKNCADLPCFQSYAGDCPRARQTAESVVLLPTYPRYGIEEVKRNVAVIRRYFER